jgi:hypothetical protein
MQSLHVSNLKVDGVQDMGIPLEEKLVQAFEKASLEWCRGNSKVWENPVRENTTHYTVGYTCKVVLSSYLALGCEVTFSVIVPAEGWRYLYVWTICPCIYAYVI